MADLDNPAAGLLAGAASLCVGLLTTIHDVVHVAVLLDDPPQLGAAVSGIGAQVLAAKLGGHRAVARAWGAEFVRWYNQEHHHSGIRYVSPAARHDGRDNDILAARHDLYLQARERHPARWSGATRNWTPIGAVTLNPERDSVCCRRPKTEPLLRVVPT